MVHVLFGFVVVAMVVTWAIFFEAVPGAIIMTPIGLVMLAVGWLASRPEDDGLSLP